MFMTNCRMTLILFLQKPQIEKWVNVPLIINVNTKQPKRDTLLYDMIKYWALRFFSVLEIFNRSTTLAYGKLAITLYFLLLPAYKKLLLTKLTFNDHATAYVRLH